MWQGNSHMPCFRICTASTSSQKYVHVMHSGKQMRFVITAVVFASAVHKYLDDEAAHGGYEAAEKCARPALLLRWPSN